MNTERAQFEADAEPMGFDLTRQNLPVPEPWSEYADENTGHRWAGWQAARRADEALLLEAMKALESCDEAYGYKGWSQGKLVEPAIAKLRARLTKGTT